MKYFIGLIAIVVVSVSAAATASAHVLVMDETKTKGAILHIIPDDDPIAGEQSSIYFDMQQENAGKDTRVNLMVKDENGIENEVPMKLSDSLATGKYVFQVQGLYELKISVEAEGETTTFYHTQRVARGVSAGGLNKATHSWADALVIGAIVGMVTLGVVVFNRRRVIAKQSTF